MANVKCVVGTNSWGSHAYETAIRGSYVEDSVIASAVDMALEKGLDVFDTADDYGFGYAQRLLGQLGQTRDLRISAKYTPTGEYKSGQIHEAFARQCTDLQVNFIDYYWLHLPNDIDQNLAEVVDLYRKGEVGHVGISNFNLQEAKHAKEFLDQRGVPLYGVQNHFSLLDRGEEKSGMLAWCQENGIAFWGWAVLEEGVLTGDQRGRPISVLFARRMRKLQPLFDTMREVAKAHSLSVAQVAVAYCISKGVVPVCGCRKPYQVVQLAQDAEIILREEEVQRLESQADQASVTLLKSDMFRFAVREQKPADCEVSFALKAILGVVGVAVLAGIGAKALRNT